ncbi:fasciclin domain-containing protein [Hyphomicrobium sp. xq]|uniref:Fasciclin domain-containing protein n=1 Tax=Hyphomicrobium album TaxID=2665159 RepID=A0A6I3KLQ3_9HYPH|nr:fasciclin domain-containing protein [Hyphomicrobium album]MTD94860.1 fasciclin domain-containing protein [Hyphomicrobium album]
MISLLKKSATLIAGAAGLAVVCGLSLTQPSFAEKTVMVGGAAMYPSKNIIENAVNSQDHTTLVAAVKAAGLVDTLSGPGPFTVFAPTNSAFEKLPNGTVPTLLKPENKGKLTGILTYHVVAGKLTAQDLWDMVDKMGGKAELKTVNGQSLWIKKASEKHLAVYDPAGHAGRITISNVLQSNGVIHVIDNVVQPN